jgi:DNA polymerase III alpha subunit
LKMRFAQRHIRSSFSYDSRVATQEKLVGAFTRSGMDSIVTSGKNSGQGLPRFLKTVDKHGVAPWQVQRHRMEGRAHEED